MSEFDLEELPRPTGDYALARAQLQKFGFCLIADALSSDEVADCRQRLMTQAAGEQEAGIATRDGGKDQPNQRVWNLVNKGEMFRDLLFHPAIRELVPEMLGEDYTLSSFTANIAGPGGEPMMLHSDQGYAPRSTPYAVAVNAAWMLEDHSAENGGTRLVPGSHLWPETPADKPDVASISADAPAGTLLMFDGRMWHGTGANHTNRKRHLLLAYFCRPFIRPQENHTMSLSDEVYGKASPELLGLLGFKTWGTLGNVNGVIRAGGELVERESDLTGELEGTAQE